MADPKVPTLKLRLKIGDTVISHDVSKADDKKSKKDSGVNKSEGTKTPKTDERPVSWSSRKRKRSNLVLDSPEETMIEKDSKNGEKKHKKEKKEKKKEKKEKKERKKRNEEKIQVKKKKNITGYLIQIFLNVCLYRKDF